MKRRGFLKRAAATAAAAGTAALPAPAIAQGRVQWRMVTTWPKNFPAIGTGAQRIADAITAMSEGRLTVTLYGAGELVPAFEVFDYVREGNAECGHDAPYYWIAKHSATPFFCSVPGGLTPFEHMAWIYTGGGQDLWDELYAPFGLRAFLAGTGGPNMGGWFRKEINSVEDLKGLKMRIPGLGGAMLNRLGVTTVNMSGGEILPALQTGALDASEWSGPYLDLAIGFHKVVKYYYGPGMHEPGPAFSLLVNRGAYEALPEDLQAIVRAAAAQENGRMMAELTAFNASALVALIKEHGVEVRHFPPDVIKAMFAAAQEVIAETAAETEIGGRIYDNWRAFRHTMIANGPYSELGFMQMRAA
jgi:TRAP-type mannitol/chloroaromatic compound transport system substrate-binding protein